MTATRALVAVGGAFLLALLLLSAAAAAVLGTLADSWTPEQVKAASNVDSRASTDVDFIESAARTAPSAAAQIALSYASAQLGLPYVWGGNGPEHGDAGFDCSGLTQGAYEAAGVSLPRTATAQFGAGTPVDFSALAPGDLVFYGDPRGFLHHVAIYVAQGLVIDAPHTGAVVRLDPVQAPDYAGARRLSQ